MQPNLLLSLLPLAGVLTVITAAPINVQGLAVRNWDSVESDLVLRDFFENEGELYARIFGLGSSSSKKKEEKKDKRREEEIRRSIKRADTALSTYSQTDIPAGNKKLSAKANRDLSKALDKHHQEMSMLDYGHDRRLDIEYSGPHAPKKAITKAVEKDWKHDTPSLQQYSKAAVSAKAVPPAGKTSGRTVASAVFHNGNKNSPGTASSAYQVYEPY